ncbi:MAG: preprotein translocase subunit SecE [Oscillospiraceae bacterium]|jgi:preprotein translocase subunit SecE|nr:preprotein translocase subunit SecE [Oscillospiraceae bacterium]
MSKKEQDSSKAYDEEQKKAKKTESGDAKAKIKRAEKAGSKPGDGKEAKPKGEAFKAGAGKFKKFWKDFRGELKKIVWPDGRTVLKNTGIVLVTVLVIGILIWLLDFGLSNGVRGLRALAEHTKPSESISQQVADEGAGIDLDDVADDLPLAPVTEATTEPATETAAE